jgi:hypothetical protein
MIMAPEGEASSGGAAANAEIFNNEDANETFDNMEYESEASKKAGEAFNDKFKERIERAKKAKESMNEDGEEEKPKAKKKEKEEPKEKKGSDIDTLPESDDTDLDGKEVKPKDKEKKEDKELKEDKPEADKTEEEKKIDAKKLKIRMSDGLYGVEADAKVRVKIDGEYQEPSIQELINNYSGKTAWDKKFTEIGTEKKNVEFAKAEIAKTQTFLKNTLEEIVGKLDDPNGNPFEALSILVEKSGKDPFTLWKRSLEANLDEVEKLMSMDEIGRENYYLKKEKEFRTKSEEARTQAIQKDHAFKQAISKVDALRQAHGISEEQYLQALDDLESEGVDTSKMSDEQVVDRASLKPHVTTVQDVLEPYEDSINDSNYSKVVQKLARELRSGEYTKEQLTEWARKEFLDEDLKDLQVRTKEVQKRSPKEAVKAPEKYESFADFDD